MTPDHGTYARYANPPGCRCDECKAAKAAYMRKRRAERRAAATPALIDGRGRYVAPIARHGTQHGYQTWMCRCFECTAVHAAAQKRQYAARKTRAA